MNSGGACCPFRVFISYSHEDRDLVCRIAEVVQGIGLTPIWDKQIRAGAAFSEAIRSFILHAHVFMAVVTERSRGRPWVHQETGYAMALGIPILPLAVGDLPGEMISQLQALSVRPDLSDLSEQLQNAHLEQMVLGSLRSPAPLPIEVADNAEERYAILGRYCDRIAGEMNAGGRVRQQARLSLFCYPDKPHAHPVWRAFDGPARRSDFVHRQCRGIRQALERFARRSGCSLIINPSLRLPELDAASHHARLGLLAGFLESMPDDLVTVACTPMAEGRVFTAVGDWFYSESRVREAGEGWRHTVFSWHAPTAWQKARDFDAALDEILDEQKVRAADSRSVAIRHICDEMARILPPGEGAGGRTD